MKLGQLKKGDRFRLNGRIWEVHIEDQSRSSGGHRCVEVLAYEAFSNRMDVDLVSAADERNVCSSFAIGDSDEVVVSCVCPGELPAYQSDGASGVDLRASRSTMIEAGAVEMVQTGLRLAIPEGYEAQVRPRSGLALNNSITVLNTPGTIDSDYRGELGVILINHGHLPFEVKQGDRIAQLVFAPVIKVKLTKVATLDATKRGERGLGSTGVE